MKRKSDKLILYGGEWRSEASIAKRRARYNAIRKTEAGRAQRLAYARANKDRINAYARNRYQTNPEAKAKILAKQKARMIIVRASKPKIVRPPKKSPAQRQKEYRQKHPEKVKLAMLEYHRKHPELKRKWKRAAHHRGMKNPEFVVIKRLRGRLHDELRFRARKTKKFTSVVNLVGCSRTFLAGYIEAKFKPGMNWENRSQWHIDHILPVSSFNMLDLEEQKKCFHYTNLQPLWAHENCSKHDKIVPLIA